jgi:hypothetical protein
MNTDERRTKKIVEEEMLKIGDTSKLDEIFQEFVLSEYRKKLGDQKPHALAVAFALWLKEKTKNELVKQ